MFLFWQGCIENQPSREEDEPIIEKDDAAFCPLNSLEDFDLDIINKAMAEDILADKRMSVTYKLNVSSSRVFCLRGTFLVRWSERQGQFVISVKQNFHCGHHVVTRQVWYSAVCCALCCGAGGGREGVVLAGAGGGPPQPAGGRHSPPGQPPGAAHAAL